MARSSNKWRPSPGGNEVLIRVTPAPARDRMVQLVFLSIVPVALMRAHRNRRRGEQERQPRARAAYGLIVAISILNMLFVVGTALWGNPPTELGSLTVIAKIGLGLGVVAAALVGLARISPDVLRPVLFSAA